MTTNRLDQFTLVGISYQKADIGTRNRYALTADHCVDIYSHPSLKHLHEFFILSTCNRTEIYGFPNHTNDFVNILAANGGGTTNEIKKLSYTKTGVDAIQHLHFVGVGLDSQILGDYEIISQVKDACITAKRHQKLGAFTERLANNVLQTSKQVKNSTELSSGLTSVSYATVQLIREYIQHHETNKILLFGTGKIGANTCKNLVKFLSGQQISLINRTDEKSGELCEKFGLTFVPYKNLQQAVNETDVIIVATGAPKPTVTSDLFTSEKRKIIFDLSVPGNVEPSVALLPQTRVFNVDELSKMKDETLYQRKLEIPKATQIVEENVKEFLEWFETRKHADRIKEVRQNLEEIHRKEIAAFLKKNKAADLPSLEDFSEHMIQKLTNYFAVQIKENSSKKPH